MGVWWRPQNRIYEGRDPRRGQWWCKIVTGPDLNHQVSEDWHTEHQCSCFLPAVLFSAGTLTNYDECPCGKLWDRLVLINPRTCGDSFDPIDFSRINLVFTGRSLQNSGTPSLLTLTLPPPTPLPGKFAPIPPLTNDLTVLRKAMPCSNEMTYAMR